MRKKAVVLLSGGMDSAVALYIAMREHECGVLIFDYGQKARRELELAEELARKAGCAVTIMNIALPWKGSSLIDRGLDLPEAEQAAGDSIPDTYVPCRNLIFLSYAVSMAEAEGADAVFIGAHQIDFSNYPDCRKGFFESFREASARGSRAGAEGRPVEIVTPLIDMTKKEIVEEGLRLGVPFELTWSCYSGGDVPCGSCESCDIRRRAFEECGVEDVSYGV